MSSDPNPSAIAAGHSDSRDSKKKEEDLSDEDLALKHQLELCVERVQDADRGVQKLALESMRHDISLATSSKTIVPKPLKFLRPHYGTLQSYFERMPESDLKKDLADVLSVLAWTMSAEGPKESLKYRILGSARDISSWGHAYVRNLVCVISEEFSTRQYDEQHHDIPLDSLMELVQQILAFLMKHNAETEAVDLLAEVGDFDLLVKHVDAMNYKRACLYLTSSSRYLPSPDDILALNAVYQIYIKLEDYASALRIALFLDNMPYVRQVYTSTDDFLLMKQLSYILACHGLVLNRYADGILPLDDRRTALEKIVNNFKLSEGYLALARDTEVMEPKSPGDIYKMHLLRSRRDLTWQVLAATFVNAFVNAGFGHDKLMTVPSEFSDISSDGWLLEDEEDGMTTAVASLGMILLWDVESGPGFAHFDKYLHYDDSFFLAGVLLGVGIMSCGVKHRHERVLDLLRPYANHEEIILRIGSVLGLGIAYAGSHLDDLRHCITDLLNGERKPIDVIIIFALSLGLVFIGSCDKEITECIMSLLLECNESDGPFTLMLPVALGLLYLGKQDTVDITTVVSDKIYEKVRKYTDVILLSFAYAGTGNVLKVQKLLGYCAGNYPGRGEIYQGPAVLGIALIAMADELGVEMTIRLFERLFQSGGQRIRRAVPLALGILCISNPKANVVDTLRRMSHDRDSEVSMAAIISLGMAGAGTNNRRIGRMLHDLSIDRYRDEEGHRLFCVRFAQGLLHMGKGLLTLSPFHSDRFLLRPQALAGLAVVFHACLDMKSSILGDNHYLLYILVLAIQPRMLMTVDENLKPISVPVRVGKAVDVMAQPGRPKTISGFQTFSTPVLLAAGERAELANDKYIPLAPVLEGFVILRENPDCDDDH